MNSAYLFFRKLRRKFFGSRILVVEDDETLRPFLSKLTSKIAPCQVDWATSGAKALFKVRETDYDLIILDIYLGGTLTGFDLWERCKNWRPHTPIVIMSGVNQDVIAKFIRDPLLDQLYLAKPLLVSDCKEKLGPLLSR